MATSPPGGQGPPCLQRGNPNEQGLLDALGLDGAEDLGEGSVAPWGAAREEVNAYGKVGSWIRQKDMPEVQRPRLGSRRG
jgi:hypothetical protein